MKSRTVLGGLLLFAGACALVVGCDKSEETPKVAGYMATTRAVILTTMPLPDPVAIITDTRPATQPEDAKSLPGGDDMKKTTLPGGIVTEDIRVGKGAPVGKYSRVYVSYVGWLDDKKTIFDDTRPGGIPRGFYLGKTDVIDGWNEGLIGMKEGGIRLLTIPPAKGYGADAKPNIPANSTLHFRIELDHIEK